MRANLRASVKSFACNGVAPSGCAHRPPSQSAVVSRRCITQTSRHGTMGSDVKPVSTMPCARSSVSHGGFPPHTERTQQRERVVPLALVHHAGLAHALPQTHVTTDRVQQAPLPGSRILREASAATSTDKSPTELDHHGKRVNKRGS